MFKFLRALHGRQIDWLLLAALCSAVTFTMELLVLGETGIAGLLRPAPGVVFVATLLLGWRGSLAALGGIAIGYLMSVQFGWPAVFKAPLAPWVFALLIAGLGAQALVQVGLLRRFETLAGRKLHPLFGILVVAPLGCLVSPSVTTLTLYAQDVIPHPTTFNFWLVAYAGSMLSVTVIYPLAWLLDRRVNNEGSSRRQTGLVLSVAAMVLGSWVLTYGLLSHSIKLERSSLGSRFEAAGEALHDEADNIDLMSIGLQAAFRRDDVEPQVLDDLAAKLIDKDPSITAIAVAQALAPEDQAAFEARAGARLGVTVQISAITGGDMPTPIRISQAETVIDQVAPASLSKRMVGLALSSDPDGRALLANAWAGSRARLSAPLRMLRDDQGHRLLAWAIPLRSVGSQPPGYLLLLQRPGKLLQMAIDAAAELPDSAWIQLTDVTGGQRTPLFTSDQNGVEILVNEGSSNLESGLRSHQQLSIGGRVWELVVALPATAAFKFSAAWWSVQLVVQLLGAALASLLVVSADRRRTLREMERQVSVLSRRYLNFERALAAQPAPSAMATARMQTPVDSRDRVLLKAFDNSAFRQFYEPVISLATGDILGFESLLRWPDASFQIAVPEIITWAERTNHVHQLTLGALRQAIEMVELWKSASVDRLAPWISINVSPDDVADIDFMERLMDLFKRHPLARRQIKLEITEGVLVRDFKGVAQRLRWVRDQGMGISLDDFGTGYSSLSYLHQLPVDSIKIDRSFISGLDSDARVREIVQATVELAHRLKIDIVAEGVEEPHTAAYLHGLGCQAVQGWLYSKAQPSTVVDEWVRTERRFDLRAA
ncbi:MAG: hypothetical protein JWQ90_558 [Hydrocarboniphaga sp.]|uniref:EAL domain-containing protein n=1 Tax=Hydrocarboniphaga sp. TaxID=2033016 RepID=UPI00261FDEC1|nr:EAL domain-containing protein [Hydrocarboniphaga sp.]MDB5968108.1 hypothetical protein [Hydrocarboniphaga sp.]